MTKEQQRRAATAARRALSVREREEASAAICERLLALPQVQSAKTLLSYRAMADEVSLEALNARLFALGKRLVYPVSLSHGVMEAREPGSWRQGPYGIWEPAREDSRFVPPEALDLVLVPCVAFDENRGRLGHGAGYYDRYLPRCNALAVCVAFEAQKLDAVVCDGYDRRPDLVVTEAAVYR